MPEEPLDLFQTPAPPPRSFSSLDLPRYRQQLEQLAAHGLYVGTSSWKYPGWCGMVYDEGRYLTRGKFSEAKFNKTCLTEYAETYSTVCVDAGYYQFPKADYLAGLCDQVPGGFKFAFKVTDDITIKKFPNIPRVGAKAGTMNPNFLNAEMFQRLFLAPCSAFPAPRPGIPLIFEFSTLHQHEFEHGRDFVTALDQFLAALPKGWEYGVEIRNKTWLQPEYFAMLRGHGVADSVFNELDSDAVSRRAVDDGGLAARPGRASTSAALPPGSLVALYEASVQQFSPYK